jgi:hypothetical protein
MNNSILLHKQLHIDLAIEFLKQRKLIDRILFKLNDQDNFVAEVAFVSKYYKRMIMELLKNNNHYI